MKVTLIFILSVFLALLVLGCSHKEAHTSRAPEVVRDVRVAEVQRRTLPDYVDAVGTVRAAQTSQISAQIVGTISSLHVHEGQQVRRGDVLVTLDDIQQRATLERASAGVAAAQQDVAAADADYHLASTTLARYQSLYEKKSVSPHEMDEMQAQARMANARQDQAQAGIAQARAAEQQARAGLSFTRIRAPFDGVITAKYVDAGTLASPGVPLLAIEDVHRFRLEANVDEGDIRFVKLGATVPADIDALGTQIQGRVVQIVPAADPASRSFLVKVEMTPDSRLRSGLFGRVQFPKGERRAIVLPKSAILDRGQLHGVYVLDTNSLASLRFVSLGQQRDGQVEVLSGLNGGERLVLEPRDRELSGKRIEAHP